jgi:dynein cytoplasmic 1 heavy chain
VIVKIHCHAQTLSAPRARAVDSQDPLLRLFARETSVGRKLLAQVRKDLADVIKVCEGGLKQTNHLRSLMSHLTKGMTKGFSPP